MSLQYSTSVLSKCPNRENVSICRVADHTIPIEDSHNFLREEYIKTIRHYRCWCHINFSTFFFSQIQCSLISACNIGKLKYHTDIVCQGHIIIHHEISQLFISFSKMYVHLNHHIKLKDTVSKYHQIAT